MGSVFGRAVPGTWGATDERALNFNEGENR